MTVFTGANYDLDRLISTHLFVICPNNSGTTYLKNVLATSRRTWNLVNEGQNTFGFAGPVPRKMGHGKLWASNQARIDIFSHAAAYNWALIRKGWYFQAFSHDPDATVFVEKSPPFLLLVDELARQFHNAKFLFMVRDPYATVEGIRRRREPKQHLFLPEHDLLQAIATHVMNCFRFQRRNIETHSDAGIFFTYEQLCETPEQIEQRIRLLVPELDDLRLRQRLVVKSYDEELNNMNARQIARLTPADILSINAVFNEHRALLDSFGYALR